MTWRPTGRDGVVPALNVADIVRAIPPARATLGSISLLLATIRVRFPLLCDDPSLNHLHLGPHG